MDSNTLQSDSNSFASSLVSSSPLNRNANLNANLATDVTLQSPLATVHGLSSVKGVLELWGALEGKESVVKEARFDDQSSTMTIRSIHTYILPVVRVVHLSIPTVTRVHFTEDEGFKDPILVVDSIQTAGGFGQYLKYGGLITTMIPETLGPFLAFAGTQHLQLSNHLAHSRRLVDTQRPPSLLAAVFSPRRTLEIALAFAFTTAISLVLGLWNRWSAFVDGLVRPIKITIDTTASHPVLNPSPISHPAGSQGQKRPHSPQNSFIAASLPPSKHSRTTADSTPPAAKPSNLQSNPVPGESYAAAVKADTVASSGPSSLLPLPDLPQGTTSTTEQIDDPDSPIIEKTTINIPFASLDQLNLGQAVNSSSDNPSSSPVVTTTTTSTATTDTQDASSSSSAAAAHPTPASELPPTRPAAPSSLNGVSSSSQPSSTIQEEASPYTNNRDALAEQSDDQEDQGGNGEHGHAEGIEVHSDVKGAFSYAKVAEKGEHAKASEVEPST